MTTPRKLYATQAAFTAHLRDPGHRSAPGDVSDRRMAVYRKLYYNNIEGLLARNFPVIRDVLGPGDWHRLVRDFCIEHRPRTPLFPEMPGEFLRYLGEGRGERGGDPPFLGELAHYEWVELALFLEEREIDAADADPEGDLLDGVPVLSPLAWPLRYRFPVHRIRPDFRPDTPPDEPVHLLVWRDRGDDVRFMVLNAVSARLVHLLHDGRARTGRECLEAIAVELGHRRPGVVREGGREVLAGLRRRDVIPGTRR